MDICVFGAGSLGSLVGGLLATSHEVTLVGRDPHVDAIRADGLDLTGEFDRTVQPAASTEPPGTADLAIVTVKSFDTGAAADELAASDLDAALSLQNGMGNEGILAERLDSPVLAGTCTYGARLREPGVVKCTGLGDVALGPREGGATALADRICSAVAATPIETTCADDMPTRLWSKLAVNAGINAPTALARVQNGALTAGSGAELAASAARETAHVARSQGVDLSDDAATEQTLAVAERTAANTSSMHQDILAGKRTEIDAINGYVVDIAEESVPVNRTLTELICTWEESEGLR
jgi:2-dehydropantoate 2-reductase